MENWKMDLHTHTCISDGSDTPEELVRKAHDAGIAMLAITDHDSVQGVARGAEEASRIGVDFIPAIEMDTEFPGQLHIVGLFIDPDNEALKEGVRQAASRREERNTLLLDRLSKAGYEVHEFMKERSEEAPVITKLHVALALVAAGFAKDKSDAFARFIGEGAPYYVHVERYSPEKVIEVITEAGGYPVLAHPCLLKCDVLPLVKRLADSGLKGIEAYYSASTEGQILEFRNMARRFGLFVSCGSDYHGTGKKHIHLGDAWREAEDLRLTYEMFKDRLTK